MTEVWRSSGECYAACIIVQDDQFGNRSVMVWEGISMEGRTDLYMLLCMGMKSLYPLSHLCWCSESWVTLVARPNMVSACRQFVEVETIDKTDWPPCSPYLNPTEHLWDIMLQS